jgi:hypothetical protein
MQIWEPFAGGVARLLSMSRKARLIRFSMPRCQEHVGAESTKEMAALATGKKCEEVAGI